MMSLVSESFYYIHQHHYMFWYSLLPAWNMKSYILIVKSWSKTLSPKTPQTLPQPSPNKLKIYQDKKHKV